MPKKPIRGYNAIYTHWILASWPTLSTSIHFLEKKPSKGGKNKKGSVSAAFFVK